MNVLVTGAEGFVGKNLVASLRNIGAGKDKNHPEIKIDELFAYDRNDSGEQLDYYCEKCDFVFHLAGVNRPKDPSEFKTGNFDVLSTLLGLLKKHRNLCPVMLSSSIQATLAGRYGESEYGKSKLAAEEMLFDYAKETGVKALVYRFPNLFGKWSQPNYNSVIATFCNNIANGLPIQVHDPDTELELVYIDDLIEEMLNALVGSEHYCEFSDGKAIEKTAGRYCFVPTMHRATLGEIVNLLELYKKQPDTLIMPEIPRDTFTKKLYSTYLSFLPKDKVAFPLKMNADARGSFTELLKTVNCGQFSVNVSQPGVTKGQHWHHSKWEIFIVVSGHGLIQQRKIGTNEILDFEVTGEKIQAVQILPGYTHNIINLSDSEKLVTVMWANESFDPTHPDTFGEVVE